MLLKHNINLWRKLCQGKLCALAALGAVVALGIGTQTFAEDSANADMAMKPHMMKGMEKCYGISKTGKNDCGSTSQGCAGQAKTDSEKSAWLAVPKVHATKSWVAVQKLLNYLAGISIFI